VVHEIGAVVALAPGGSSNPRPGILPARLAFKWGRDVPTLVLVADNDVCLPIDGMYEIFERIPAAKRMIVLRRADHMHFMDNVEQLHETARTSPPWIPELEYLQKEMRPIAELCTSEQSHLFVRGLTVAHFDAVLKQNDQARRFLGRHSGRTRVPRRRGLRACGCIGGYFSRALAEYWPSSVGARQTRRIPLFIATTTASVRSSTPILWSMFNTCFFTVRSLTNNAPAISLLLLPAVINRNTSTSRGESAAPAIAGSASREAARWDA
jgi:hypothetical protein